MEKSRTLKDLSNVGENRVEVKSFLDSVWQRRIADIPKAMIMKKNMIAKGVRRAKAKCPHCAGHWQGVLAGAKFHFHMRCDGDCGANFME